MNDSSQSLPILDAQQTASRDQFDKRSAAYGTGHILSHTGDIEQALPALEPKPGDRLLDVACGGGHCGLFFCERGLEVRLADIAPGMLEKAAALALERGFVVNCAEHSAETLPYEDATFDFVSCRVAAHHFSDVPAFVSEVTRVLRAGGKFLLIDGTVEDGHPAAEAWIHAVEKARDPSHGRFVTPDGWSRLCVENGMTVLVREPLPFKQPDLQWYFDTAATSPENREEVMRLVREAPQDAKNLFQLNPNDEGKITWFWQRLVLVAEKK